MASRNVGVKGVVAMFLDTIDQNSKNRSVQLLFCQSSSIVSRHFNAILHAILCLQEILLKKLEPLVKNSTDDWWKGFKVGIIFINKV